LFVLIEAIKAENAVNNVKPDWQLGGQPHEVRLVQNVTTRTRRNSRTRKRGRGSE